MVMHTPTRPDTPDESSGRDQDASGRIYASESSGGGAKHRMVDPPTTWPSVADPHAASTIDQGGPPGLDPTTTPCWAYGLILHSEANKFGKEFLRMAGIVQMLHARTTPSDKYSYAYRERTFKA